MSDDHIPSLADTAWYDQDETCMECGLDGPRCICEDDFHFEYVGKHRA